MSPVDSPRALAPGTRILDYTILSVIGSGGFSIVYKAMDTALRRIVAIKEYFPPNSAVREGDGGVSVHLSEVDTFRTGIVGFLNEGKLLAQFDHPALVRVYQCWEQSGTAYIAMPLYEGLTLKDALKDGSFQANEVTIKWLLLPLFETLELLHDANCYHRDVAPDNILLGDNPVLLDFGAARKAIESTQTFTAILKPGYAPIEQYGAGDLKQGPWTDIYAVAAVLVFTFTGQPPLTAISRMINDSMPRPRDQFKGLLPERWLDAIERGLGVKPEDRPQNIAEFRALFGWDAKTVSRDFAAPATRALDGSALRVALPAKVPAPAALAAPEARKTSNAPAQDEDTVAGPRNRTRRIRATAELASAFAPREVSKAPSVAATQPTLRAEPPVAQTKSKLVVWVSASIGIVAMGALYLFVSSGGSRLRDTSVAPPQKSTDVKDGGIKPATPTDTLPSSSPTKETPLTPPTPPTSAPATTVGTPSAPAASTPSESPPAQAAIKEKTALGDEKAASKKRPTTTVATKAKEGENKETVRYTPPAPATGVPERCVGILQDYSLGAPLSDDDIQFLRTRCR